MAALGVNIVNIVLQLGIDVDCTLRRNRYSGSFIFRDSLGVCLRRPIQSYSNYDNEHKHMMFVYIFENTISYLYINKECENTIHCDNIDFFIRSE